MITFLLLLVAIVSLLALGAFMALAVPPRWLP